MKGIMKNFVLPVGVLVVGTIIAYLFMNKSPNIVYNITDSIPISITGIDTEEKIQQIQINNIGNDVAKDVHVIIDGNIKKYEVQKANPSDEIKVTHENDVLEIIYPSLIADDEFSISVVSDKGINVQMLSVKDSSGMGEYVYQERSIGPIVMIIVMYVIFIVIEFIFSIRRYYNTKTDYEKILKKKKILFMDEKETISIKKRAIYEYFMQRFVIDDSIGKEIQQYEEKKNTISDEKVKIVFDEVTKRFLDKSIDEVLYRFYDSEDKIIEFLAIEKPSSYESSDWDKKREKAIERLILCARDESHYTDIAKSKVYYYLSGDKTPKFTQKEKDFFMEKLNEVFSNRVVASYFVRETKPNESIKKFIDGGKPVYVTQNNWDIICNTLYDFAVIRNNPTNYFYDSKKLLENYKLFNSIKHSCSRKDQLIKFMRYVYVMEVVSKAVSDTLSAPSIKYDKTVLSKENIELIEGITYSKSLLNLLSNNESSFEKIDVAEYEWLNEGHKKLINSFHEEFDKYQTSEKKYNELCSMYIDIMSGKFESSNYEKLDQNEIRKASEINKVIKENIEGHVFISKHRNKILQQLDIINAVLGDPSEVNRIEEYNNPFSEKNFENLKYVAELIVKAREDNATEE